VIIALRATAVRLSLGHDLVRRVQDVLGKWAIVGNTPLMVTFHPSYLLRNNTNAAKYVVWEDMLEVIKKLNITSGSKIAHFQE
jgi:DNA polymerase